MKNTTPEMTVFADETDDEESRWIAAIEVWDGGERVGVVASGSTELYAQLALLSSLRAYERNISAIVEFAERSL